MKHEQCSEQIVLRVAPPLRKKIERAASDEGRSLANMTRRILERWAAASQGASNDAEHSTDYSREL
jgi:hypothetical protein